MSHAHRRKREGEEGGMAGQQRDTEEDITRLLAEENDIVGHQRGRGVRVQAATAESGDKGRGERGRFLPIWRWKAQF
jgi:hypothetical protein